MQAKPVSDLAAMASIVIVVMTTGLEHWKSLTRRDGDQRAPLSPALPSLASIAYTA